MFYMILSLSENWGGPWISGISNLNRLPAENRMPAFLKSSMPRSFIAQNAKKLCRWGKDFCWFYPRGISMNIGVPIVLNPWGLKLTISKNRWQLSDRESAGKLIRNIWERKGRYTPERIKNFQLMADREHTSLVKGEWKKWTFRFTNRAI